jgi:hypothetical protein
VVAVSTATTSRKRPNAYSRTSRALIKRINEKKATDLAIPVCLNAVDARGKIILAWVTAKPAPADLAEKSA